MQTLLNLHARPQDGQVAADGIFGPKTNARVLAFQSYCGLETDGVVGPLTSAMLLPERTCTLTATLYPGGGQPMSVSGALPGAPPSAFSAFQQARMPKFATGFNRSFQTVSAGPVQPAPNQTFRQFQVQAGGQVALGPFALSPLVITAQYNQIIRNPGKFDFLLTFGAQFALNTSGASGNWTGQGFGQMGLALNKKVGDFDFLNPFVVMMLQRNQGQPFTWGTGIGNQTNYSLDKSGRWSLLLNVQGVVNVDLTSGLCSAPGLQILGGVGFTFGAIPP
jgi:hypothetical protein